MKRPGKRQDRDRAGATMIRTFVCVEIPKSIKDRIEELQLRLKSVGAEVSWVKTSNIHLTLKFLGGVPQPHIKNIQAAVERASRVSGPFEVEVGGTGCFPSLRSPHVLWVGLSRIPDGLKQLYPAIEDELEREGFAREPKRFAPHLTIGRVRTQRNIGSLVNELMVAGFEPMSFQTGEITVMRSDLKPTGAIYTPQAVIPLGRTSSAARE